MNSRMDGSFSIEDRISGLLNSRAMEIGEFCDSVAIVATSRDPDTGETVLWSSGAGDAYARDGALRAYMAMREKASSEMGSSPQDPDSLGSF